MTSIREQILAALTTTLGSTSGVTRYTANFTPPTAPFPDA